MFLIYIYSIIIIILIYYNIIVFNIYKNYYFLFNKKIIVFLKLISNKLFIINVYIIFFLYIFFFINNYLFNNLIIIFIFSTLIGQIVKIFLKNLTKIKRPISLNNNINNKVKYNNFFFIFLKIDNTYSFPSGHTLLIHNLLLFIIYFNKLIKINIILLYFLIIWSYIVIFSRLLLKMHRIIDIIFSIIINLLLFNIINIFIK